MQRIFANSRAFAALHLDGSVTCWGDVFRGGDVGKAAGELQSGVERLDKSFFA